MEGTAPDSVGIPGFPNDKTIYSKINSDNNNEEELMGLGFALGSDSQCTQRGLTDDSGAGANASSRADMTFVALNPLSELVWSPHKGLGLKCTDCSLTEKKPLLLWGTESENMVLSPLQSIRDWGTNNDKTLAEDNFSSSQKAFHLESDASERFTLANAPRSTTGIMPVCGIDHEQYIGTSYMAELNTAAEASVLDIIQKEEDDLDKKEKYDQANNQIIAVSETKDNASPIPDEVFRQDPKKGGVDDALLSKMDEPGPCIAQIPDSVNVNGVISSNPFGRQRDDRSGNQTGVLEMTLSSEVSTFEQFKAHNAPLPTLASPVSINEGLVSVLERDSTCKINTTVSTSVLPMVNPAGVENDLLTLKAGSSCAEVSINIATIPGDEIEHTHQQDEKELPDDKPAPVEASPKNSRSFEHIPQQNENELPKNDPDPLEASPNNSINHLNQKEEIERSSSDGEIDVKISKEKDDSHESVESCNSTGMLSGGKRQWGFEEQHIIENRRVKKKIQDSSCSGSLIGQDSSFLNWISNMLKGLPKPNQDERPCTALAVTYHGNEIDAQKLMMSSNKNKDSGCGNMGFKTMFQSLYSPNMTQQEMRTWDVDHQIGEEKKELVPKMHDINSPPISSQEDHKTQPNISSANFLLHQAHQKIHATENNISCKIACGTEKCRASSSNSFSQYKTNNVEKTSSGPPSEKLDCNVGVTDLNTCSSSAISTKGPLGSLWITRFSQKVPRSLSNVPQCSKGTDAASKNSPDCGRSIPHSQNCSDFSHDHRYVEEVRDPTRKDPMNSVGKKFQRSEASSKAYFGLKLIKGHSHQKHKCKVNPILPSQRFKSSEAMASVLARRLDALRHIITSTVTDSTHATTICFFCGIKGHNIQECADITETELEDLLRNITSYSGAEESPCMCIRCFQLNHWAIACPNATMRRSENDSASLVNHTEFRKICGKRGNDISTNKEERSFKLLEYKGKQCQFSCAHADCDGKNMGLDNKLLFHQKMKEKVAVDGRKSNSEPVKKYVASSFLEVNSSQIAPICKVVNGKIPAVPKGIFEAIRRLRLSRTDILKWMKSPIPLIFLEGFYLRVRFGKWEEGLGGTGYYVAVINGAPMEKTTEGSRNPLNVDIGGLKYLVENQYISNHDFDEDEYNATGKRSKSSSTSKLVHVQIMRQIIRLHEVRKMERWRQRSGTST